LFSCRLLGYGLLHLLSVNAITLSRIQQDSHNSICLG
jgi:hypothetical protein